jgi:hypothetical protein
VRFARCRTVAVACAATVLLASCISPSRTRDDYVHKARATAGAVDSAVETVLLVVDQISRDSMLANYASVTVGDAEQDAQGAEASLSAVQPPDQLADGLRTKTLGIVGEAIDAIAGVRIAVRRNDTRQVVAAAKPLPRLAAQLRTIADGG